MRQDILAQLADETLLALIVDGREWPRPLFGAAVCIPDAWMGLVETRDGRRRYVPAGDEPRAEAGDRLLLVRNRLITVPLTLHEALSSDKHAVDAEAELLLRWPGDDEALTLLRELVAQHNGRLTQAALTDEVCEAGGDAVLRKFVADSSADRLVGSQRQDELRDAARGTLQRFLFRVGAQLERVGKLEFVSSTLAEAHAAAVRATQQVQQIRARELVEGAARTALERRLEGLSGVIDKLRTAADRDQDLQWHDLLPALSPAERGRLLENLWRMSPDRHVTQAVVVVLGDLCVWLDPGAPDQEIRRVTLPDDLGGLRSISAAGADGTLLVGAARGVWVLDRDTGLPREKLATPEIGFLPRTGFNGAVQLVGRIFATHSQLGCWSWSLDDPGAAHCVLGPEQGVGSTITAVRAITPLDEHRFALAADQQVLVYSAEGERLPAPPACHERIYCLNVLEGVLYAGLRDGALVTCELGHASAAWTIRHRASAAFESVQPRRWSDLVELVIPAGRDGVLGVYPDEQIQCRLLPADVPLRRAWASDDAVVGLSELRDKLIVLSASSAGTQPTELPLARQTGHTIQDACLVLSAAASGGGTNVVV